jgi:predicted Zn-dependent protease
LVNRQLGSAEARFLLANAYAASGQTGSIQPHLIAGIQAEPDSPLIAPLLQRAYLAMPDLDAKRGLLGRLGELPTPPPGLPLLEARLCLDQEDYLSARHRLDTLFQAQPENREVLLLLLRAQAKGDSLEAATATAEGWIEAHPDDIEVRRLAAQVYAMRQMPERAVSAYRELLRRAPNDRIARNNLAMLLLEQDPAEALALVRQARREAPDDPNLADTLGQALIATGEAAAAIEVLSDANALAPKNPAIAYHFARALIAAGEPARARAVLQPMLGQPFPEEEAARTLLAQIGE